MKVAFYHCFNPLQVQTKLTIQYHLKNGYTSSFNPLQVQTKQEGGYMEIHQELGFQSPIGTNKTFTISFTTVLQFLVSIPYRYKKNQSAQTKLQTWFMSFNPLQVQKKPMNMDEFVKYGMRFNPLQVQKKQISCRIFSQRCRNVSIPYRYKKNTETCRICSYSLTKVSIPYRYKQNCHGSGYCHKKIIVSIPYRYKQNSIKKIGYMSVEECFNPLQVQTNSNWDFENYIYDELFQSPIGTNKHPRY